MLAGIAVVGASWRVGEETSVGLVEIAVMVGVEAAAVWRLIGCIATFSSMCVGASAADPFGEAAFSTGDAIDEGYRRARLNVTGLS